MQAPAGLTLACAGGYTAAPAIRKGLRLPFEPLDQYLQRKKNRQEIEALGFDAFPHRFAWTHTPAEIVASFGGLTGEELERERVEVAVPGRVMTLRMHGKAGFAHIQGQGERVQVYVKLDVVGERLFQLFRLLDMGDIVGVRGHLFRTKTNELTVWVRELELLTKALLPLPEKWHGLADVERRYRQRYLDLIANAESRRIFLLRAQLIAELRRFFDARGYVEVETPMMQPIAGGATARPFVTHHKALDMYLFLRIAPELYLKRLVVGGLDRVYEINRNFRNEGLGWKYNPEFTMLEFYQAYSDYRDLMDLNEEMLPGLVSKLLGTTRVAFGEHSIDFARFERLTMREAIARHWPAEAGAAPATGELGREKAVRDAARRYNDWARPRERTPIERVGTDDVGVLTGTLFELVAQDKLIQPTILYDFPKSISPLAKSRKDDPSLTERFEIYAGGMEIGNAFSELNDPDEQEARFREQIARGGDEVPRELDVDYIRALCHGLPPTAGQGLGVDRLVMLLTNSHSIREVILFPVLRPEAPRGAEPEPGAGGEGG